MASRMLLRWLGSVAGLLIAGPELQAQFLGLNLRGDVGLKSGTQPPPGLYLTLPLYYGNDYEGVEDQHGNTIGNGTDLDVKLLATPAIGVTTDVTILGATYGFQVIVPLMSHRLAIAEPSFTTGDGYGFADMYVQPLLLGWRLHEADFRAGYAFFAPTGSGRRTLDMWAHELSAGSTVYLDESQRWHVSGTAFYEIHHNKRGVDLRVGDILTIEGGLGGSFMNGAGNAGFAYLAQWKITNDSGDDFPANLPKSKSRVFGLGPEATLPVFAIGTLVGLLNARYVWEFGGRSVFEGQTFVAGFTLAKLNTP